MDPEREFPNKFPDFNKEVLLGDDSNVTPEIRKRLMAGIERLLSRLETEYNEQTDPKDFSVYTGTAGVGMLYWLLSERLILNDSSSRGSSGGASDRFQLKSKSYIDNSLKQLKSGGKPGRAAFLGGESGPLAISAVLYECMGEKSASKDCLKKLMSMSGAVLSDSSVPNEVLFGRAGYLYSLLYVSSHLGANAVDKQIVNKVTQYLLDSGRAMAEREKSEAGLMFEWHDKKYLGAAHGLAGILYIIMQASKVIDLSSDQLSLVKKSVDYLLSLQFKSGNFPSSIGSGSGDKLVHWCHGAPGWVYMFLSAYQIFKRDRYLNAAKSCGEVVWTRGILRKGYGLCHGVAGNAYCLLALYNVTNDSRYLHRAIKFAEWCLDYGKHGCRTPDRPYSLFEGMAGTIYFLVDILQPTRAKFPAFQL